MPTGSGSKQFPALSRGEKNTRKRDESGRWLRDTKEISGDVDQAVEVFRVKLLRELKVKSVDELSILPAVRVQVLTMRWRVMLGLEKLIEEKGLLSKSGESDVGEFVTRYMQHSKEFDLLMSKLLPPAVVSPGESEPDGLSGLNDKLVLVDDE